MDTNCYIDTNCYMDTRPVTQLK